MATSTMSPEDRNDLAILLLDLRHQADDLLDQIARLARDERLSAGHRRKLKDQRDKLLTTPSVIGGIAQELRG